MDGRISIMSSPGAPLAMSSPAPKRKKTTGSKKRYLTLLNVNCHSLGDKRGDYVTQYYCNDYDDGMSLVYAIYQVC